MAKATIERKTLVLTPERAKRVISDCNCPNCLKQIARDDANGTTTAILVEKVIYGDNVTVDAHAINKVYKMDV